jgi:hypothetical protein
MTDRPLNHWQEQMVAALHGELSAAERAELESALAEDESLRRDWHDLTEAHAALVRLVAATDRLEGELEGSDRDLAPPPWARPARPSPWRVALAAGAGFAVAASLFVGLLLAGLRVDRTPDGVLVHLDRTAGESSVAPAGPASSPYATREELASVAELLAVSTANRLDQLERRQTAVQAEVAQTLYDALAVAQQRQYRDLRDRIELAVYRPTGSRGQDQSAPTHEPWHQ